MVFARRKGNRGASTKPPLSVFLQATTSGLRVIAFGPETALDAVGERLAEVPQPIVRGAGLVASGALDSAQQGEELSGALMKLTPQAKKLLRAHPQIGAGEGLLGVIRNADGTFDGQLTFVDPTAGALSGGPALAAAAALQIQMAIIEQRLEAIRSDLGDPIDSADIDVKAELATELDIIGDVFAEVRKSGELTSTQWDRVVNLEAPVRRLHYRSSGHLRRLEEALTDDAVGLGERVRRLKQTIRANHTDQWLDVHVHADKGLMRWQILYLLRHVDEYPERAAEFVGAVKADVNHRFEELVRLGGAIVDALGLGHQQSWTDRFRVISQGRLRHVLAELNQILNSYRDGVEDIQLEVATASALEASTFDIGAWSELGDVAGSPEVRSLELLRRTGSRLARSASGRADDFRRRIRGAAEASTDDDAIADR